MRKSRKDKSRDGRVARERREDVGSGGRGGPDRRKLDIRIVVDHDDNGDSGGCGNGEESERGEEPARERRCEEPPVTAAGKVFGLVGGPMAVFDVGLGHQAAVGCCRILDAKE